MKPKNLITSLVLALSLIWMIRLASPRANVQVQSKQGSALSVVVEGFVAPPILFALDELKAASQAKGLSVRRLSSLREAGDEPIILARNRQPSQINTSIPVTQPEQAAARESLTITHQRVDGRNALVVTGSGDRGLMYGLLEVARTISYAKSVTQALSLVREVDETPELAVRGMVQFLHNADLEREWYYDKEYWRTYLGMLAKDRFNSFNLVFAHQTAYLAPPYPFLVNVDKYPQIRVPGLSDSDRERNLQMLQYISHLAKERGIDFIMGIWEHMAWRRGQQSMVEGLTEENVTEYTRLALTQLLRACPDIAGIQLRVNTESGIENRRQTAFYRDAVFAAMREAGRPILLDLRGWGALPETIRTATQSGLPMRLSMKYWAEFMGFPYEPAETPPSYSYADFLRYPRTYPTFQQVWSLGSHRLLLWGDSDYVRHFAPTCHLGNGLGFEICAPLSQKGYGNAPGVWRIFTSKDREYYRWEFERYWMYYLLFGRLTYNTQTPDSVWMDELAARFGAAAPDVLETYKWGSQVISFLIGYHMSNPNMYIWPEKQMGGLLDFYLDTYPSDRARIADIMEASENHLKDQPSAKMTPSQISARLSAIALHCRTALSRVAQKIDTRHKEFAAMRLDMEILSWLAEYHAQKVLAGEQLAFFYKTGHYGSLKKAQTYAQKGLAIWEALVKATDGVYYPHMVFGPEDVGHWKDNLVFVRRDVARLQEVEKLFQRYGLFDIGFDFGATVPETRRGFEPLYTANYSVEPRFKGVFPNTLYDPQKGYGWISNEGITAQAAPRIGRSSLEGNNLRNLRFPSGMLYVDFARGTKKADFVVDVANGSYQVLLLMGDISENPIDHGPMRIGVNGQDMSETVSLTKGQIVEQKLNAEAKDGKLTITLNSEPGADWILNGLIVTRMAPHVGHVPLRTAEPGVAQEIEATVQSPDAIENVRLHYKREGQPDYQSLFMRNEGVVFREAIPARAMASGSVAYFLEAEDKAGHVTRFPAAAPQEAITIHVGRDRKPPTITHQPITACDPQKPLVLKAQVSDDSAVRLVRLHYRHMNQFQPFQRVVMQRDGSAYRATIPAEYIGATWDLMYYIEAVDEFGNGAFYPDPDKSAPYVVVTIKRE